MRKSLSFLLVLISYFSCYISGAYAKECGSVLSLNNCVWKLQRASNVHVNGVALSLPDFADDEWIQAIVPGTVLNSYLSTGEWPDPNYGNQQLQIPDSFFTSNFWYRTEFEVDAVNDSQKVWLNFDGINWKADIFLNGQEIGDIKGAYTRKKIDITKYIKEDSVNALAVLIYKNDNPGEVTVQHLNDPDGNGGIIGFDSPTILASIGWNWMPTIRGRNIGIWNDVYLSFSGDVTLEDPFIKTFMALPDTSYADICVEAELVNHANAPKKGFLKGEFADKSFQYPIDLKANETKKIVLTSKEVTALRLYNPDLWWPNGYGNQPLYQMNLSFQNDTTVSDTKKVTFGVRQYSYSVINNNLRVMINGIPLVVRGGNWGMAESMLRCDSAGYDLRVRLHKEMNLNMIRNWIGMVGDDEFYEACDRYGIMVWDDFWLANPVDGPHPKDEKMFMANVVDKIKHFRNHPSIALWTGRNEGYPPATLDSAMRIETSLLDGTRYYLSHSAASPVTGLGPYENKDPKWYFTKRGITFHSEQGIVVPPTLEGMKAMMPEEYLWPVNDMWGMHDWTQERVQIYTDDMIRNYGAPTGIEDFCRKAQMQNMEGPKALMESWQSNRGPGVLVWMSHPAWPSMICQTYDYYFEPTATFYAFKNACEPLHILWRADTEQVQVANNTLKPYKNLKAVVELWDLKGAKVFSNEKSVDILSNSIVDVQTMEYPHEISDVHFIRLLLKDNEGKILSSNFYWRGKRYMDYRSMDTMEKAKLQVQCLSSEATDNNIELSVQVENVGEPVAVMLRLLVLDKKTGKRILPIYYEDNFFSVVPGEKREIKIRFDKKLVQSKYELYIEGWNLKREKIKIEK